MHHHKSCPDKKLSFRSLISSPQNHQGQRNTCTAVPDASEQFCLGCCQIDQFNTIPQLDLKSLTTSLWSALCSVKVAKVQWNMHFLNCTMDFLKAVKTNILMNSKYLFILPSNQNKTYSKDIAGKEVDNICRETAEYVF